MTDQTFTQERAGFLERMGRLAGQSTYRVPVEGVGTKFDHIPESHGLIVTLCGARGQKWQPGPEIAFAVATGIQHQREKVVQWLMGKLYLGTGATVRTYKDRLRAIAEISYLMAVGETKSDGGAEFDPHMRRLASIGAGWLAMCMDETIHRAESRPERCQGRQPA